MTAIAAQITSTMANIRGSAPVFEFAAIAVSGMPSQRWTRWHSAKAPLKLAGGGAGAHLGC